MSLGAPAWLVLLLTLPLLWWLSLPPRPRRALWTPHLAQVERALAALRRRPPRLSRLRFLLLAIAVAAAAMAAARPQWRGEAGAERLVVVLDASASMAAHADGEASAWSVVTGQLRDVLARVPSHVDVTVLRAGGTLHRRHGASARELHDLGQPAGPLACDLAAVASASASDPATAVWTCTDGQGGAPLPSLGALTVVPRSGPNAAVLGVRMQDAWPLPALPLAIELVAFAAGPARARVQVRGAVTAPYERELDLAPGVPASFEATVERSAAGGPLEVVVALPGDVLPADDVWRVLLPPLPAPRIAVLEEAAEQADYGKLAAAALAAEVGGEVVTATTGARVGLLLVDGGRVAITPGSLRAVTFGCAFSATAVEALPWERPAPLEWSRSDELMRGLDLSELRVDRASRGLLPAGEPFLWALEDGVPVPLAVVAGDGDIASVHFAFRLADSNLPLLAAFPQLLRRAFVRCYGRGAAPLVTTATPAAEELDLRRPTTVPERPLPPFASQPMDLTPVCLLLALVALACRCWVR